MSNNYVAAYQGLKIFRDAMLGFIAGQLEAAFGDDWLEQAVQPALGPDQYQQLLGHFKRRYAGGSIVVRPGEEAHEALDVAQFIPILEKHWSDVFDAAFPPPRNTVVQWLNEVKDLRNSVAHPETGDLRTQDVARGLDSAERVVRFFDAGAADEIAQVREALRDPKAQTGGDLPAWWMVTTPHRDIREGRFDASVFAADLGEVLRGRGAADYRDPVLFFQKTYPTRGLSELLVNVMRRLAGEPVGEPVIQLQTPFGGGKTHALLALYHLFGSRSGLLPDPSGASDRAADSKSGLRGLPVVGDLLQRAGLSATAQAGLEAPPTVRTGVFVGTDLNPAQGRTADDGTQIRTPWGELAYQLGGPDLYAQIAENDTQRVAPGADLLSQLLAEVRPALILVDEPAQYLAKAGGVAVGRSDLATQTLSFFQELTIAVANQPQVVLVATLPSSQRLEVFSEEASVDLGRLENIFRRIEQVLSPVEGTEIYEVLRRRLFEDVGPARVHRQVAQAFWEDYRRHRDDVPRPVREPEYRDRMVQAYPFHPELIEILYERWGSLPHFQRTRGVLRLLALVIGDAYRQQSPSALIRPADVNLGNDRIRNAVKEVTDQQWESVIASDISGFDAKAPQIDRLLGSEYHQERVAESLATSIFMYTPTGGLQRGAGRAQLRLSLLHPGLTPAIVADTLDRLTQRLFYLYLENELYRFSTQPNLNKMLVEREAAVDREPIEERLRQAIGDVIGYRAFYRVYVWPESDKDIANSPGLSLVVLDPSYAVDDPSWAEVGPRVKALLDHYGVGARIYRNTLIFLLPDVHEIRRVHDAARRYVALQGIARDYLGKGELSDQQEQDLERRLEEAQSQVPQTVAAAYRHIAAGGPDDALKTWNLGAQSFDATRTLSQRVWDHLQGQDQLLERLDPLLLTGQRWNLWPAEQHVIQVQDLWGYFTRFTYLPILAGEHVMQDAIARGVQRGLFGYALGDGESLDFDTRYFEEPISAQEVDLIESAWLVRPAIAREWKAAERRPEQPEEPAVTPTTTTQPRFPIIEAEEEEPEVPVHRYYTVTIETPVPWENWYDFYNEVIDPLVAEGAEIDIRIELQAQSEAGIDANTIELRVKEALVQRGLEAEITTE